MTAGMPEAVREDGGVGGAGALLAHQPHHVLAVELDGQPGESSWATTITCSSDGIAHSSVPDPPSRRLMMRSWIAWRSARRSRRRAAPDHRFLSSSALNSYAVSALSWFLRMRNFDRVEELLVLGHEDLGVEDPRFLGSGAAEHLLPELVEVADDFRHRFPQALDLDLDLIGPHRPVRDVGEVELDDERGAHRHPGRHADATHDTRRAHGSPNPPATS